MMLVAMAFFAACNSPYTSKKRGYFKIDFPERQYRLYNDPSMPYSFEYPVYANVVRDSTYFDDSTDDKYWINLDFPQYSARVFLSYKPVGGRSVYKVKQANGQYKDSTGINEFEKMINDAYNLTSKNQSVATSIKDSLFVTPNNVEGVYFKVGGNAATGRQFFLTDSVKNFIRGALYFSSTPNADSIKPVQDFLEADIRHLINTFRWRSPS